MLAADESGLLALSSVLTPPALVGFQCGLRCHVQVRTQPMDSGAGDCDGLANTTLGPISQWREIAQELRRPSHEPAKGPYDIIGFSSGFPAVETPWSRRHWLEFKINWVSILFHMLRECLNVRLLRGGSGDNEYAVL